MSRKILNLCRLLTLTEVINHLLLEKHKTKETPLEAKAFPAKWIPFLHRHSWTGEDARQPCSWNSLCGGLNVSYFSGESLTLKLSCQMILKSVFKKNSDENKITRRILHGVLHQMHLGWKKMSAYYCAWPL